MSRPLKPIEGELLGSFFMREFIAFAKAWKNPSDLDKLAITFPANDYPWAGNPDLLKTLFIAAAFPERILEGSEAARLLVVIYKRTPDFYLSLLAHLRSVLQRASSHRRLLLLRLDDNIGPKAICGQLREAVELGTVKAERRHLRLTEEAVAEQKRMSIRIEDGRLRGIMQRNSRRSALKTAQKKSRPVRKQR